jgi:hypothetical protein
MAEGGAFFDDGIGPNIDALSDGLLGRVASAMQDMAPYVLDHAQTNAPWSDRTGDARAGLDVEVYEEGGVVVLDLFHTMDYGLWLEIIQSGRFATIMPTLEALAAEVFAACGAVVSGQEGGDFE